MNSNNINFYIKVSLPEQNVQILQNVVYRTCQLQLIHGDKTKHMFHLKNI